jgi:hypothetical protein
MASALTSKIPFADPSWHTDTKSPYYKDSHRKLQRFIREYVDSEIVPNAGQWEEQGYVPEEAYQRHAQLGFLAAAVYPLPKASIDGLVLPAGIPADGMFENKQIIEFH